MQVKQQDVNWLGQGLIQSAAKSTSTQGLEHDLDDVNTRWKALNKKVISSCPFVVISIVYYSLAFVVTTDHAYSSRTSLNMPTSLWCCKLRRPKLRCPQSSVVSIKERNKLGEIGPLLVIMSTWTETQ